MILAIDGVGAKFGGAAAVLLDVVEAALAEPAVERLVVFGSPRAMRQFDLPVAPRLVDIEVPQGDLGPWSRLLWQQAGLARAVRRAGSDVVLCLGGGGRAGPGARLVNYVQQSLPFIPDALRTMPLKSRVKMRVLRLTTGRSCKGAALVVVQTATMKRTLVEAYGLDPARVAVVEPAPRLVVPSVGAAALAPLRSLPRQRCLLYVGNDVGYKNLGVVARAMPLVRQALPGATLFATLPPGHAAVRCGAAQSLGWLAPAVVAEAYRLAGALLMPSLAETVGLPLLEAAAAGTPVVAADRPYAHDVCGDAALYFDASSPEALAARLVELLEDQSRWRELSERGLRLAALRAGNRPAARLVQLAVEAAAG